ncbi:MAG TPA: methyltransferase domain-containing protein, partial [Candidatus Limnocylindrales bacterium]|nr:methyltransferase domain-containing protein [Candidatus Limnocylindrales bacterium]
VDTPADLERLASQSSARVASMAPVASVAPVGVVGPGASGAPVAGPSAGPSDDPLRAWAERVRANREQVDRLREVPDATDFYGPVSSIFRADPHRTDDPVLDVLRGLARSDERWLDIGAGAGRFALPLALRVREVIALDPSPAMLGALREIARENRIRNVRVVEGRWPDVFTAGTLGEPPLADVALIAHVGYDIEAIGPFLDAMDEAAARLCVAVLMERVPAAVADPFWPVVHGEARVSLPALPEFLAVLGARGKQPETTFVERPPRAFPSRADLERAVRHQLWIADGSEKERRFCELFEELAVETPDGFVLRTAGPVRIGIVRWQPDARAGGASPGASR